MSAHACMFSQRGEQVPAIHLHIWEYPHARVSIFDCPEHASVRSTATGVVQYEYGFRTQAYPSKFGEPGAGSVRVIALFEAGRRVD